MVKKYFDLTIEKHIEEKGIDQVDWDEIVFFKLSEEFIEKYADNFNWSMILKYQRVSEEFVDRNKDRIKRTGWRYFSMKEFLTEDFIRRNFSNLDKHAISICQKLSEKFIIDHYEFLDFEYLQQNEHVQITDRIKTLFSLKEI
ncbi:tryptophan repeat gene family protein [Bacillus phage vB_BpuM-BpSp]|nr:tryptophan repeat gene family protein [Bacillus phage vB_BpuM-BpSp]